MPEVNGGTNAFFIPEEEAMSVLNAKQDTSTVLIPRDEYVRLIDARARLNTLRFIRFNQIRKESYIRVTETDCILGEDVVTAIDDKNKAGKDE